MSKARAKYPLVLTAYAQQRVDGWRTGSRGSQSYVLALLLGAVVVLVAITYAAGNVIPPSAWFIFMMLGLMLLRFVPLLLLTAAVLAAATWASSGWV